MDSSLSADQKASLEGQLLDEVEEASATLKTLHATLWKAFEGTACQELNNSGATPDSFPALLRCTFPHYSGPYPCATPVHHWTGPDST